MRTIGERRSGVLPILPEHEQQFLLSGADAATSDPAEGMGTFVVHCERYQTIYQNKRTGKGAHI